MSHALQGLCTGYPGQQIVNSKAELWVLANEYVCWRAELGFGALGVRKDFERWLQRMSVLHWCSYYCVPGYGVFGELDLVVLLLVV